MYTDQWLIVAGFASAVGTIFLGIIALFAIRQTSDIQRRQVRINLLREIIEWAEGIISCGDETGFEFMTTKKRLNEDIGFSDKIGAKYLLLRKKLPYIEAIAPRVNVSPTNVGKVIKGIIGVMAAIKKQHEASKIDFFTLNKDQIEPLALDCADLIEEVSSILVKEMGSE